MLMRMGRAISNEDDVEDSAKSDAHDGNVGILQCKHEAVRFIVIIAADDNYLIMLELETKNALMIKMLAHG